MWSSQTSPLTSPFQASKLWFRKRRIVQGQQHDEALSHAHFVERVGVSLSNTGGKNNWYSHGRAKPIFVLYDSACSSAAALQTNSSLQVQNKWGLPRGEHGTLLQQFASAQNISAVSLTCKLGTTGET